MLGKIFAFLTITAFLFGALTGRTDALCSAVFDSATEAVDISISLLGSMCLWSGIIRVLDRAGLTKLISALIRPILKIMFPSSYAAKKTDLICADMAANVLGMGNAAMPLGIAAMKELCTLSISDEANDDMIMLALYNTAPFVLMPTTLIALRVAAGSTKPYSIILPIWITSIATIIFTVTLAKLSSKIFRHSGKKV